MGITRFSGPVYGAKQTLLSGHRAVISSGLSTLVIGSVTVPLGEDWYVTEVIAGASTCTTGVAGVAVTGNSTAIAGAAATITSTETWAVARVPSTSVSQGEYEGYKVTGGTVLEVEGISGSTAVAVGNMNWAIRGYSRWVDSTIAGR